MRLDTGTLLTTQPATCYWLEEGLYFCCRSYLESMALSPLVASLPIPGTRPQRDLAQASRRNYAVASFCDYAVLPGAVVSIPRWLPLSFFSLSIQDSGSPLPLLWVLSNPYPGRVRCGPYPLTPRCTMPDQSPHACEPQCPFPRVGTGSGHVGS